MLVRIVVSKSDAEMVKRPSPTSTKKLSKIGKALLVLKTPEMLCKCFNKALLDTTKFILYNLFQN
jgi:hypothetical protein